MIKILDEEITALDQGKSGPGGFMTSFVRAIDVHTREASLSDAKDSRKGLSGDETFGDLFVISFAGHDTTVNSLSFATLHFAAHPEVQG